MSNYPALVFFLLFFLLSGPACRKTSEAKMEDQVKEICDCFDPVMRFEEFTKMAITIEDTARLARLAEEYEKIEQVSTNCRERWEETIAGLEESRRFRYEQALKDRCFDVATMLEIVN